MAERHLVTIGHSYVVGENRRLAHEMALAGGGRWQVTAIAPTQFRGDLRKIAVEPIAGEASVLRPIPVRFDVSPHLMRYRGLREAIPADADVVHAWEEPYVAASAQIAATAPRSASLVFATFQNLQKRYPWPFSRYEQRSLTRADGWIAFGHTVAETLAPRALYAARPHRVIPPGVDVDRFRPDPARRSSVLRQIGWPDDALVVGYLGRFVPEKGLDELCRALEGARAAWHALFVGGGVMLPDVQRLAARFPSRVHIAQGVSHSDVPRWLQAMTILCAPSRSTATWREQFGRMLIEAMASGVPVAASRSGEMPWVVGDAGELVEERNVAAWSEAIERLLLDDGRRRELAARGIARAQAEFAWPVVARAHLAFFDWLLDARPRRVA